jgi:hypothetical protein
MSEKPLPEPTVRPPSGSQWETSDVRGALCNPAYVGIGPFKEIVPEDIWLRAAEKQIAAEGAEQFLVNMVFMLKASFVTVQDHPLRDVSIHADNIIATGVGPFPALISDEQWIRTAAVKLREQGAGPFLRVLLHDLRETLHGSSTTPTN